MTEIFVFGSNQAGRHGKGAAWAAWKEHGAEYGVGEGRTGSSYAIPTKGHYLEVLQLAEIEAGVDRFIEYAKANEELTFNVTAIGTGLAGYDHEDIAPLFRKAPSNCKLCETWELMLKGVR